MAETHIRQSPAPVTSDDLQGLDDRKRQEHALIVLEALELRPGLILNGFRIADIRGMARGIRIEFECDNQRFGVVLERRDPARRCFASTASFNIVHERLPESMGRQLAFWLHRFAELLLERDPGSLDPQLQDARLSNAHADCLEHMFRLLPNSGDPQVGSLCGQLTTLVRNGILDADFIEPSFTLGRLGFRLGVNATSRRNGPSGRAPLARSLLDTFGLSNAVDDGFLDEWLSDEARELFLGIEIADQGVRQKVYLRTRTPDGASLLNAARALGIGSEQRYSNMLQILSMDYRAGKLSGHKLYVKISSSEAREMSGQKLLVPFLDELGLLVPSMTFYHAFRFAREEALGSALYAEFPTPVPARVGLAYALRADDQKSERFLRGLLEAVPLCVSTLSETLYAGAPRHIYLSLFKR